MKLFFKIIAIIFLLANQSSFAQKVDIDKLKFNIKRTLLPKKPQGENVYFYDVNLKSNATVRQHVSDDEIIAGIKIDGMVYAPNQPNSVLVNIVFSDFLINRNELITRTEETKDKEGKVTSRKNYYKTKITYTFGVNYDVKNSQKQDVISNINYMSANNYRTYETSEFGSSSEANKYYLDNNLSIKSNILKDLTIEMGRTLSNFFSYEIGYKAQSLNEYLWILDSKKHEEFENHQKITRKLAEELQKFTEKSKVEDINTFFGPIIEYYTKLSKLDIEDKHQKKLVYASLYNLATLYYYLDDPIQSKIYAQRLIKDDIDEKDGKELVKNADYLIDLFKKNNKFSTHFEREIPNPDQALIPVKSASTQTLKTAEAVAQAPRFVEGMVITNEDKEIDGYFFNEFENAPWEVQDGVRFIASSLYNDGKFDKKSVEKFTPKELKGLVVAGKIYIPALFSDVSKVINGNPLGATAKKYFLEVIKDGKYKVLSYHEAPPTTMAFSGTMDPKVNTDNLEKLTVLLAPGEDKAKKITTSYLEEILATNKTLFDKYQKGAYSVDGKAINVKRDMIDRMTAKSSLDKNIDFMKIIEDMNK